MRFKSIWGEECRLFAYMCFVLFVLFVPVKFFHRNKIREVWNCLDGLIYITTEFILLLTWSLFTIFFITISFNLFFFITIFFNLFTIFLNLFTTCNTIFMKISQRMNSYIFYRQNMTKIFCQFHKFLIYAFYFEFFSFCV